MTTNDKNTTNTTANHDATFAGPLTHCEHCGGMFHEHHLREIDGTLYCSDCIAELFTTCDVCGEMIRRDDAYEAPNGDCLCESCFDERFVVCSSCGDTISRDDVYESPDGDYLCEYCFDDECVVCERCGDVIWRDDAYVVHGWNGDALWCDCCASYHAYRCEACGDYFAHADDMCNTADGLLCESCAEDEYTYCAECGQYVRNEDYDFDAEMCHECAGGALIGHYHQRPELQFFGECKPQWRGVWRGLGIELEIDKDNDDNESECAHKLLELGGKELYFNRDGSLNNGFEIITQPHTVDAFYNMKWREILSTCREYGYKSHDAGTCGLHMHLSREYFGTTEEAQGDAVSKLIRFYDVFWNDILKVSRRTEEQANHWAARYCTESREDAESYGKKGRYAGRYHAVNTTNYATIELRLTRGTLNESTFFACIDFMLTIAKNAKRISWKRIDDAAEWLKGIKPATAEYIKARGAFRKAVA